MSPNCSQHTRRLALTACVLLTLHLATGCTSSSSNPDPSNPTDPAANLVFDSRINWVTGDVLVLPLAAPLANSTAVLVDGTQQTPPLQANSASISVTVTPEAHSPAEWIDAPGRWTSSPTGPGTPVIVIDPGSEAASGDLVVGSRRYSVNWLPLPEDLVRADISSPEQPWTSPLAAAVRTDPSFISLAERERLNPLTRWRYRLIFDGLDPAARDIGEPFPDRTIEAIARQNENRWRVALAWLWGADPAVADSLKKRLVACITMPDGRTVPAWPTAHTSLDDLLTGLLDPTTTPAARARRAERWIDEQVIATAWVIDDGGMLDSRRGVVASVGIANISERATLGWAGIQESETEPDPQPLPAHTAIQTAVPMPDSLGGLAAVELHAGKWMQIRGVIPGRIRITPPGLDISSLLNDWTMRDWLNGTPSQPTNQWNTRARLSKLPGGYGWELNIESQAAAGVGDGSKEQLNIFAGPPRPNQPVITVHPSTNSASVRTAQEPGGWRTVIELPPESVEADGTLRLAITRTDARGRRSTWPRPMFPWQTSPARAALNLNAWDGFSSSTESDSRIANPATDTTLGR